VNQGRVRQFLTVSVVAVVMVAATVLTLIALNPGAGHADLADNPSASIDSGQSASASPTFPPTGGISANEAADLARSHVQDGAVLVSAVAGTYRDVFTIGRPEDRHLDTPDQAVWAVTFSGEYEICPPNGEPCWSPRPGQTQVILDYTTGEFLESGTFAPA
jgi:zona occludens toxin (predicted ATPase)